MSTTFCVWTGDTTNIIGGTTSLVDAVAIFLIYTAATGHPVLFTKFGLVGRVEAL